MAVAVAVACSYSSDLTPSLGTSICCRYGPEKQKKKNQKYKISSNLPLLLATCAPGLNFMGIFRYKGPGIPHTVCYGL